MAKSKSHANVHSAAAAREGAGLPTIAIVGRPNVGKSTLFNRLAGSRRAIVGDEPGITRDRLYGFTEWNGRRLRVVDTGGIVPGEKEFVPAEIFRQAKVALQEARNGAVVLVVDGRSEISAPDIDLARILQRAGSNVFLAVNKIDTPRLAAQAEEFRRLGHQNVFPISAENGDGVAELLDAVLETVPEITAPAAPASPSSAGEITGASAEARSAREARIAIIGRPNVGKSTLLNRLTGSSRAIVSPLPGTTRDAVDELIQRHGQLYRFIDTAGIRRKGKTKLMAEKLSVVMARKHLEAADIALLVIDAAEGVTASDATIAGYAHESGRSLIVVINKWDLVTSGRAPGKPPASRKMYEQQARDQLKFLSYAPLLFVSATEGAGMDSIFATLEEVAAERKKRITTGEMNRFLRKIDFQRAGVPAARQVKIYYMTQAGTSPPTFVLFTDRKVKLHFAFQRFLENRIREAFGFAGAPIRIKHRARE